ncbi:MAG TPA: HD-GYP domain-containing protein, partial [Candidatus Nitrosotenuis sp.]|nr:HD-GYP domain-containing protein [Candidatus Nitrosotenuis sp.]
PVYQRRQAPGARTAWAPAEEAAQTSPRTAETGPEKPARSLFRTPGLRAREAQRQAQTEARRAEPLEVSAREPAARPGVAERVARASEQNPLLGAMLGGAARSERLAPRSLQEEPLLRGGSASAGRVVQSVQGRQRGGGQSGGEPGQGGQQGAGSAGSGQTAGGAPSTQEVLVRQARVDSYRLAASHQAFRISMQRLESSANLARVEVAVRHAGHSIESILKRVYRCQDLEDLDETEAVNSLTLMLKLGGEFTYAHSARVLDMAMELADEVGITDEKTRKQIALGALLKDVGEMGLLLDQESEDKLQKVSEFMSSQDMLRAGLLHDIGKVRVPPEILFKPGRLTEEEYEIMKMHPVYGEQIVYPIASLRHLCPTIRGHHERWDGKGYPDGLKGENIPLPARVIAVADVFDALAAERPYKKGMPLAKVVEILKEGRGTHFDPDLVDAFVRVVQRRFPTGEYS